MKKETKLPSQKYKTTSSTPMVTRQSDSIYFKIRIVQPPAVTVNFQYRQFLDRSSSWPLLKQPFIKNNLSVFYRQKEYVAALQLVDHQLGFRMLTNITFLIVSPAINSDAFFYLLHYGCNF